MKRKIKCMEKLKNYIRKIGTLNLILIFIGVFFIWFNWMMLCTFKECGSIPETYACTVVGSLIGECGICGWIRTTKDRQRERKWEKEDKEQEDME